MDTPSLQIAQEHKGTLIRCKADGDPVPKISWYFNGMSVNGNLLIHCLSRPPVFLMTCLSTHSDQQELQRNWGRTEAAERVAE